MDGKGNRLEPNLASHMGHYVAASFHPHLHCVVTGGGLAPDGSRWLATRPDYFLPVKVLGRLFRGKFWGMDSCHG